MKKEYAEEVAAKIIEQLEQGTAPWQKPWKPGELTLPYNAQTGKEYRGINSMWLAIQGHSDPRWMTYNQASDAGAQVRKGSKGTKITYWKFREERQAKDEQGHPIRDEEGKPKIMTVELERPRAFHAVVFNAEQIDGLPPLQPKQAEPEPERHARAEAVLLNSGANIQHIEGDRAFYRPSTDSITLPARHQFPTADAYYATALHELGHWTGHLSRLDRDLSHPFGSERYAKEELRAEIASLMLGERMDIGHDPGQHVAYVGSWIKALKEDPKEIFRAASDAEKITGFVMTFEQEQEQMKEQEQGRGDAQQQEDTVLAFITDGDGINRTLQFESTSEGSYITLKLPDDPNELRDQANRGELRAIQQSSNIDMVPVADIEIGLRFRDLLRDTAQSDDDIGADAKDALDYYANAYAMNKTREEMKRNGATAEDMIAEENKHWLKIGFDIRTGNGTGTGGERVLLGDATPTETALMLRSLSNGDRPEVMPEPKADDPEVKLRAIWDKEGVPKETQDALIAEIEAKAKPGARVGPFVIPGGDADAAPASSVRHHPPENPMPDRTYLAVPYAEKEQAKASAQAAGFKLQWDKENKAWFAPAGADLSKMEQWKTDSARVQIPTTKSAEDQFADALKGAGLIVDGLPVMDGKIHRVPVAGDQAGELSGAYAGHMEGRMPGGYIQNYKTGERVNWKAEGNIEKASPEERVKLATEAAQRQQRRTSEAQAKYEVTAKAAATLWSESPAATAQNPYCMAKGIDNPGAMGLRVVPDAVSSQAAALGIKIAKTAKEAKELREADPDARVFKSGDLLVPGHDEKGKLWTLQSVNPYFKSFMKGGRKHGLFTVAGANPGDKTVAELLASKDTPIVLAEGYATADTVAKLSSQPVIVAFDSGNLNAVAETMRQQFPERTMIVAADNDHRAPKELGPDSKPRVNVGLEKAKETAKKYGAGVAAPQFKEDEKGSDWNDIKENRGFEASKKMLTEQLALAKREAAIMSERLVGLARTREMEARNNPTTSLDDAVIAAERGKAVSTIISSLDKKKNSKEEMQQSSHPQRVKSIIRDIDAGF